MTRMIVIVTLIALGIGAVALILFTLKLAFLAVLVGVLCIAAVLITLRLSGKRLRSTPQTRPPTTT
jgi:hypothetical protein